LYSEAVRYSLIEQSSLTNMKVYFISGLGADRRLFKNILLPVGNEAVFLDWIVPLANESLADYSRRLAEKIDTKESYALIGLSMGGMIVSEICKSHKPSLTIIISGIPVSSHIPFHLKLAGRLGIHRLIPARMLKSVTLVKTAFSSESARDRMVLQEMIREIDDKFINWAIRAIMAWRNDTLPSSYIHIHGTWDRVLPIRFTKPTDLIEKAGHLMILNRASEINRILERSLISCSG
jgi:pimeloyl-ACP methyl ester carboxylesterase